MIEETIIKYLSENLADPVYAEKPEDLPERHYIVERVGGTMSNRLYTSMFAIQSISVNSLIEAAGMNDNLLRLVFGDDGGLLTCPEITRVGLSGNTNNTDPETHEYKYQALFEICHY